MKTKFLAFLTVGGILLGSTCINTIASLPLCGEILTFCEPVDQIELLFPYFETPDYSADPSCTIPGACGDSDLFEIDGFGGNASAPPSDNNGGG